MEDHGLRAQHGGQPFLLREAEYGIVLEPGQTRLIDTAPNILADPRIGQIFRGGVIEAAPATA